jgi:hypothetical protein
MKAGQFRTHPNLAAGPLCADEGKTAQVDLKLCRSYQQA